MAQSKSRVFIMRMFVTDTRDAPTGPSALSETFMALEPDLTVVDKEGVMKRMTDKILGTTSGEVTLTSFTVKDPEPMSLSEALDSLKVKYIL